MSDSTAVAEPESKKTAKAWSARAVHKDITLPSGFKVDIRLPNLAAFVKAGSLPSSLLEATQKVARASREGEPIPPELYEEMETFNTFLVTHTVVNPSITEEEVDGLPSEDVEMIVGFATRRIEFDAIGHHLAGLETVDSFRKFRGLDTSAEDLLSLAGG